MTLVTNIPDTNDGYVHPSAVEPTLCCVSGNFAYFTTRPLSQQTGEGWHLPMDGDPPCPPDSPSRPMDFHEGSPHAPHWSIVKLAWDGNLYVPHQAFYDRFSPLEVNRQVVPWLIQNPNVYDKWGEHERPWEDPDCTAIWAGAMIPEFFELVESVGGHIFPYMPYAAFMNIRGMAG